MRIIALAPVLATLVATGAAAQPARYTNTCIRTGSNVTYKPVDENTILVRDGRRVFKIGVNQCHNLRSIHPVIVNVLHGSNQVCGPLDLQLTILDDINGFPEPCIAQSLTELTPAQIDAIPKRDRP